MNLKKTLITVGFSAALSAVPLIAQADLTSNTAITAGVDVLAKDSSKLPNQRLELTENIAGAVNDQIDDPRDIVLSLDNNAKFVEATVTWGGTAVTPTIDDDGNLVIPVTGSDTAVKKLILTNIYINTTSTAIGSEIKVSLNTDLTTATGAAFTAKKLATVVDSDVEIKNASGTVPKFKSELAADILDIIITENAAGAIATERSPKAIIVTLPTGWTFVNHGTHTAAKAQSTGVTGTTGTNGPNKASIDGFFFDCNEGATDADPCTFDVGAQNTSTQLIVDVDGADDNPGKFTLGGGTTATLGDIQIKAPANATAGDVYATVAVELFNGETKTKQLKIAEVVNAGITATVVDYTTTTFTLEPVADTTLPEYPKGFLDAVLDGIMIVENFGDDLTTGDSLTLTLPDGVVFSQDWVAATGTVTDETGSGSSETVTSPITFSNVVGSHGNPKGFNSVTITITDKNVDDRGGLLIGGSRLLKVNIGNDVPLGDLVAVLSGTVSGEALTDQNLTLAKIVEGGTLNEVVLAEGESVPTHGVGSSGRSIAKFTITEVVGGALKANNNTITFTLPEGITWAKAPTVSATNVVIPNDPINFTVGDRTVTFPVTTASTTAGVITVTGDDVIDISADYTPGDINVEIGGTAGATNSQLLIAKAANGTRLEVLEVTKLVAGKATQDIASIRVIENFAGALTPDGKFRLILPKGLSWAPTVPTVPTVLVDGETGVKLTTTVDTAGTFNSANDINEGAWTDNANSWEFEISTTFNNKDTLVVQVPNTASTGATVVPVNGLKVNVDASVADGVIKVTIDDGNTAGKDGAGVTEEDAVIGYIGELPEFKVEPLTVTVGVGDKVTVTATGGLGTANISTAPDAAIATATALNNVITITGVAEGTTSVVISDGTTANQTQTVSITVTPAAELSVPATATVEVGKTVEVQITGGTADFAVTSSDETIATATLKDKTITITGVAVGTADVTVTDGDSKTAKVTVTVKEAATEGPTLPSAGTASGVDKDGNVVETDAKFYGGVSGDSGATYGAGTEIDEDTPISFKAKIEVATDHKGKKGKYYVVAGYQPAGTQDFFWWFHKGDKSWVDWLPPFPLTGREANLYKETDALETIEITIVENFSLTGFKGKYFVFLAYETEEASIYFNPIPIEFTIK